MVEHGTFKSFDGVKIAYYTIGNKKGMPVILSNGLGGNIAAWASMIDALKDKYLFITWDYRGLYRSGMPYNMHTLTVPFQTKDLEILLEKLRIKKALFIGWSMGVQINFEFYRTHPDAFLGIIVLSGASGYPFETAKGLKGDAIRFMTLILKHISSLDSKVVKAATELPFFFYLIKMLGLVAKPCSEQIFMNIIKDFRHLNFKVYFDSLFKLGEHSAEDVLTKIKVPTLIVVGEKDLFTPPPVAESMRNKIKHSELYVLPDATHYALAEFPDSIIKKSIQFIKKHRLDKPKTEELKIVEKQVTTLS